MISRITAKEALDRKQDERAYILEQLRQEEDMRKCQALLARVTEHTEVLWSQSASKHYKILEMNSKMDKISKQFLNIWSALNSPEVSSANPHLTMMMARFCDFVLGFELEAEALYLKAQAQFQSMKLQQVKGFSLEDGVDTSGTSEQFIISVHCTGKSLDKVVFAN